MIFAHDTENALVAAVALVNSAEEPDSLVAVTDLDTFYREHGYTGGHRHTRSELAEVRAIRARLRSLLGSERDRTVEQINAILADTPVQLRLVRHGDMDWHVHAIDDDAPLATRILVETAMAMIDVVRADELDRLALCAAQDCAGLVLDLSRNRSRRFCSTTCGNRVAVAAYRARQAEAGG